MSELNAVLTGWRKAVHLKQAAVLATIVDVDGASYRRPGARMLVTEPGETFGNISAGCLEKEIVERSRKVIRTGQAELVTFDTRGEQDAIWGQGLGCNGVIRVLMERLSSLERVMNPVDAMELAVGGNTRAVILTCLYSEKNRESCSARCEYVHLSRSIIFENEPYLQGTEIDDRFVDDAREVLSSGKSKMMRYQSGRVFFDVINPPTSLVIFGAEPDAFPLVRLAGFLGWRTTVIDVKARSATRDSFHEADEVVLCRTENVRSWMTSSADAVVMMTHSYLDDVELLRHFLDAPVKYLGIMGPRDRTDRIIREALGERPMFQNCFAERMHSPIGVDLGAETPEEVALSIVSEITAVNAGSRAGFLRDRKGTIHHLNDWPARDSDPANGMPVSEKAVFQLACASL